MAKKTEKSQELSQAEGATAIKHELEALGADVLY